VTGLWTFTRDDKMINCVYATFREVGLGGLNDSSRVLAEYVQSSGLGDYVLCNTCNRAEAYSTENIDWTGFRKASGVDAVRHLYRVACGLESMLAGENEILGQVKKAYLNAVSEGHCSREMSKLFESACRLGSRARAKTRISEGRTSIASLAVEHVLSQNTYPADEVLVVGSGTMGSKIASALRNRGVRQIFLANRRRERAEKLAEKVGGKVADYRRIGEFLGKSSVVFTATSAPHAIIKPWMIPEGSRILFVDLSVPYDVSEDVKSLQGVEVIRLDYFRGIAEKNSLEKTREVEKVEAMIDENIRNMNDAIKK